MFCILFGFWNIMIYCWQYCLWFLHGLIYCFGYCSVLIFCWNIVFFIVWIFFSNIQYYIGYCLGQKKIINIVLGIVLGLKKGYCPPLPIIKHILPIWKFIESVINKQPHLSFPYNWQSQQENGHLFLTDKIQLDMSEIPTKTIMGLSLQLVNR